MKFDLGKLHKDLERIQTEEGVFGDKFDFFNEGDFQLSRDAEHYWESQCDGAMPADCSLDPGVYVATLREMPAEGGSEKKTEFHTFSVEENGTVCELDYDDKSLTPVFHVENLSELLFFLKYIREGAGQEKPTAGKIALADMITGIYVPFTRPNSIVPAGEDPLIWARYEKVNNLLQGYFKEHHIWPYAYHLTKDYTLEVIEGWKTKDGSDFIRKGYEDAFGKVAESLTDADILPDLENWNSICSFYHYLGRDPAGFDFPPLYFKVALKPEYFAPWFSMTVNPEFFVQLVEGVREVFAAGDMDVLKNKVINVPGFDTQVGQALNARKSIMRLRTLGQQLTDFRRQKEGKRGLHYLNYEENLAILKKRADAISNLLAAD